MPGMISSLNGEPRATELKFRDEYLEVVLEDGRIVSVPLDWYPRLERATAGQRKNFRWLGRGLAIEWPDIDEHLSIAGFLRGEKAPRSNAYLYGIWSEDITKRRAEVEKRYAKKNGPIASSRTRSSVSKKTRVKS